MEEVSIEEFQKLDLRVARIISVEDHPRAEKLYFTMLILSVAWNQGSKTEKILKKPRKSAEDFQKGARKEL